MSTSELIPAYILHQIPYRESSLILETLTEDHGRIPMVYRGGRKTKSNRVLLFSPAYLSWLGKGDLKTLTGIDCGHNVNLLSGQALLCGFYVNELIVYLTTQHQCVEGLFSLYQQTIRKLAEKEAVEITLRLFEKHLLIILGYGLQLNEADNHNSHVDPTKLYQYEVEKGPVSVTQRAYKGLTITGKSLIALNNEQLDDPQSLKEIKQLMRWVLTHYLNGRPLKSRELFKSK